MSNNENAGFTLRQYLAPLRGLEREQLLCFIAPSQKHI
jgi:hypothetical protein